jgi:hypothetical protein
MVTGCEIKLRGYVKALPLRRKFATYARNLGSSLSITASVMLVFAASEKLNQAHPDCKVPAVALL